MEEVKIKNYSGIYYDSLMARYEYWMVWRKNNRIWNSSKNEYVNMVDHRQYLMAWVNKKAIKDECGLKDWKSMVKQMIVKQYGKPPEGITL